MPKFDWDDKDMRYSIAAFPWVGAVIGAVYFAVFYFGKLLGIPAVALALILTAVPLILTGGFHVDGYMDTKDALNSYKDREEKLQILKDPHTGAFAVIWLGICGLIYAAMTMMLLSLPDNEGVMAGVAMSFFLARCLSGFDVLLMPKARKDGMLHHESDEAHKSRKLNLIILGINTLLVAVGLFLVSWQTAVISLVVAFLWNLVYYGRCKRQFGGITGDTAGYFVVKCELYIAVVCALAGFILTRL